MNPEARGQTPESYNPPRRHGPPKCPAPASQGSGFTLIEILVALAVMSIVCVAASSLLATVGKSWQRGTELSKDLHAGDFVIEQITGALRAARYRNGNDGLILKKKGLGSSAEDSLSWVKEGPELVGSDSPMAKTFHHVTFTVGTDKHGNHGATFTAWGDEYMQPDDFDPESLPPEILSDRVVGLNVRVATNHFENDKIEWMNEWEGSCPAGGDLTNHLPRFVEITLYLKPLDEGDPPIEMRRLVDIPISRMGFR